MVLVLWALTTIGACLEDLPVDGVFPCRKAEDCVDGFVCHPSRFVCVDEAQVTEDGGVIDAGLNMSDGGGS